MQDNLNDLALFVSVHERRDLLERSVAQYADLPCRRILLDSSASPLLTASEVPAGWEYVHERMLFEEKLRRMSMAPEPFVTLVNHDDFILPGGLQAALGHLRDHPELVCTVGEVLIFTLEEGGAARFYLWESSQYLLGRIKGHVSDPFMRLYTFPNIGNELIYGVWRRENFARVMAYYEPVHNIYFSDLDLAFGSVIEGDFAVVPCATRVRDVSLSFKGDRSVVPVDDVLKMDTDDRRRDVLQTIDRRARHLAEVSGESLDLCRSILTNTVFYWPSLRLLDRLPPMVFDGDQERINASRAAQKAEGHAPLLPMDFRGRIFPRAQKQFPGFGQMDELDGIAALLRRWPGLR